jgi:hypothetical protein
MLWPRTATNTEPRMSSGCQNRPAGHTCKQIPSSPISGVGDSGASYRVGQRIAVEAHPRRCDSHVDGRSPSPYSQGGQSDNSHHRRWARLGAASVRLNRCSTLQAFDPRRNPSYNQSHPPYLAMLSRDHRSRHLPQIRSSETYCCRLESHTAFLHRAKDVHRWLHSAHWRPSSSWISETRRLSATFYAGFRDHNR